MKKIVKKWEGGAKKHGGFGKAMGVQIDKWIQSAGEEQARQAREEEELRQQLEHERLAREEEQRQRLELEQRLAKEAEERERLVQEQLREVLELSKRQAEELATQKLAKEAEEQRQRLELQERLAKEAEERERLEQEQIRKALELSQKQALAEKLSKESFEKSQRDKILDFLSRSQDVSDEAAFPAMDIVKRWESTNTELIEKLHGFRDEALDKFLSSVEIAGDSSF